MICICFKTCSMFLWEVEGICPSSTDVILFWPALILWFHNKVSFHVNWHLYIYIFASHSIFLFLLYFYALILMYCFGIWVWSLIVSKSSHCKTDWYTELTHIWIESYGPVVVINLFSIVHLPINFHFLFKYCSFWFVSQK